MNRKCFKLLALIMSVIMCINSVNLSVFAEESTEKIEETVEISMSEEATENSEESMDASTETGVVEEIVTETIVEETEPTSMEEEKESESTEETNKTEDIYEGGHYKVTFVLSSQWEGGYNANVKIENTGDSIIENWYLTFVLENAVSNIWNAQIDSQKENEYVIKNVGWNADIPVGGSVEFGISSNENFVEFPENYTLLGENTETDENDYTVEYIVDSDWGSGFTGRILITNNTEETIEDWVLEFDFENEISNIWDGVIESHEGNHYVIHNAGYNQDINPGSSVGIGFTVSEGTSVNGMEKFQLFSMSQQIDIVTISEKGLLFEDGNYELGADFSSFSGQLARVEDVTAFTMFVYDKNGVLIYQEEVSPKAEWATEKVGLVYGINRVVFRAAIGSLIDEKEIIVNCKTNVYFENLNVDLTDSDEDGLHNYFEKYFGTDENYPDTDRDGLTDFQELYSLGYNPLSVDTDDDGVLDCDEDEDEDGLSNGNEYEVGTSPLDNDSDNDRLEDNVEIEFGTSPIVTDTDNDGISDYEEYQLKDLNAVYDEATGNYTAVFSADKMGIYYDEAVIPTVKLTADADGILNFNIERVESSLMLNPSMAGYIGAAYDFTTSGEMKGAELTFTYDESLLDPQMLNADDFCPTIYYYNPDEQTISEVEGQVWEGNTVSVNLQHFSTYILVNKADMEKLWNQTLEIEGNLASCNHVVFVMDRSGSMSSSDRYMIRTSLIREFCGRMNSKDKIGLVGFADYALKYSNGLVSDEADIEAAITKFEKQIDNGGTYMNEGVEAAVQMLMAENDEDAKKSIFVLTDGSTSDKLSATYLNQLVKDNITIYTVGLGSVSQSYLKSVAESTGGKYFYAKTSSDLSEVFIDFEDEIDQDINGDGLNDELTKLICKGEITTITGTKVFCAKDCEESWEEMYNEIMERGADFDDDGLKNGEEIEIFYHINKPYIEMNTSPMYPDTDCDCYSDYDEIMVMFTNPVEANYTINSSDYLFVNNHTNFEAGKAHDAYLDNSSFGVYFLDVLLCGGEFDLARRTRKELLDFFVSYTTEKEEELDLTSKVNDVNSILRGFMDILPELELGHDIVVVNEQINNLQKEILAYRGVANSKWTKNALKKGIKELKLTLEDHVNDVLRKGGTSELSKFGTKAGIALSIIACAMESIDNALDYDAALSTLIGYEELVYELQRCGVTTIEVAAKQVQRDLESVSSKYIRLTGETFEEVLKYGIPAGASYYITSSMGLPGLLIDLAWVTADVVLGESLSVGLTNVISVDCAIAMGMVTQNNLKNPVYSKNSFEETIIVQYDGNDARRLKNFWMADIAAKGWCEEKYLGYLQDDRFGVDTDHWLYHDEESESIALDNIYLMSQLLAEYNTKKINEE